MVTVQITDQNDNSPYFPKKSYSASVEENAPLNKTLLRVQALDVDIGRLLCWFLLSSGISLLAYPIASSYLGENRSFLLSWSVHFAFNFNIFLSEVWVI